MAYGLCEGSNLTRFVCMCHSNMCYMSDVCVCLLMSDRIMSATSHLHLHFNLPLTIVLTKEENRNTTLDIEIMDRYTGLVCLDIHRSILPRISKFQYNHVQFCVITQLTIFLPVLARNGSEIKYSLSLLT